LNSTSLETAYDTAPKFHHFVILVRMGQDGSITGRPAFRRRFDVSQERSLVRAKKEARVSGTAMGSAVS
jgi:hypothetical protein